MTDWAATMPGAQTMALDPPGAGAGLEIDTWRLLLETWPLPETWPLDRVRLLLAGVGTPAASREAAPALVAVDTATAVDSTAAAVMPAAAREMVRIMSLLQLSQM
ncbi:hypothetical protein GCM10025862_06740 [Arsenicicoccus piscis]|uniref:Uncharacterized protein n=1 Tax=Arsenicicoccus piscis TaxID=673954 RepID=A0ABQ6HLW4_9MICO|nr:hypothetical protein GCM10025862_06740 [Arsenicicoccus piscis]